MITDGRRALPDLPSVERITPLAGDGRSRGHVGGRGIENRSPYRDEVLPLIDIHVGRSTARSSVR